MLWYFNVRLIEIPGLLKACSCWISSKFGGVRRDKNLQLESVVLHSWTPPAFISSQSTYLTSNLQLSTIQRGLLTPYVLTGQTPQAFPLILPVLLPLYPHFYFWLTKPEEFIIPETFMQNESKPSRGRLFFFPGLSDNETMAYTQPIITATDDRWCFAMWTVTLEALFCYPEQPGSVCEENGFNLCWKEDFFIGILACQKGLNDVKIFQSSQRLSGQSSSSQTNIISRNKKQSLTSFLSLPIQALQGCDVLEPVPAHTGQEVSVIRPATVHTHIHTYGQVRVAHSPIGTVGGNMCRHGASHTSRSILTTTTQQPPSLCPENECWRSSLLVQMFHQNEFPSDTILSRYGEINVAHGHVRMQTYQRFAEMLTAKIVSWWLCPFDLFLTITLCRWCTTLCLIMSSLYFCNFYFIFLIA